MSQAPILQKIEESYLKSDLPVFRPGDTVRVHTLIKEGDKERVQVFEGLVIDRHDGGVRATFTVRKTSLALVSSVSSRCTRTGLRRSRSKPTASYAAHA